MIVYRAKNSVSFHFDRSILHFHLHSFLIVHIPCAIALCMRSTALLLDSFSSASFFSLTTCKSYIFKYTRECVAKIKMSNFTYCRRRKLFFDLFIFTERTLFPIMSDLTHITMLGNYSILCSIDITHNIFMWANQI